LNILPLILLILFALIKASARKQQHASRAAQKQRAFEEANQSVSRNFAAPEGEHPAADPYGEYEYGEYAAYAAGFEPAPSVKEPTPVKKRRPSAAVRPPAAAEAPKGEGTGEGSLQGLTSIEAEVRQKLAQEGSLANPPELKARIGNAYESSFAPSSDDAYAKEQPSRTMNRPSLVFAQNPVVNGIIWNEVLKRPNRRRR
jgi:hypothetical protein